MQPVKMIGKKVSAKIIVVEAFVYSSLIVLSFFVCYSKNQNVNEDLVKQTYLQPMKIIPFTEQQSTEFTLKTIQDAPNGILSNNDDVEEEFDKELNNYSSSEWSSTSKSLIDWPVGRHERSATNDFRCASFKRIPNQNRVICVPRQFTNADADSDSDDGDGANDSSSSSSGNVDDTDYNKHENFSPSIFSAKSERATAVIRDNTNNNQTVSERITTNDRVSLNEDNNYSNSFLDDGKLRKPTIENILKSIEDKLIRDDKFSRWIIEEQNKIANFMKNKEAYKSNNNNVNEAKGEFETGSKRAKLSKWRQEKTYEGPARGSVWTPTIYFNNLPSTEATSTNLVLANDKNEKRSFFPPYKTGFRSQYFDNKQQNSNEQHPTGNIISNSNSVLVRSYGGDGSRIETVKKNNNKNKNNPMRYYPGYQPAAQLSSLEGAKGAMQRSQTTRSHRNGISTGNETQSSIYRTNKLTQPLQSENWGQTPPSSSSFETKNTLNSNDNSISYQVVSSNLVPTNNNNNIAHVSSDIDQDGGRISMSNTKSIKNLANKAAMSQPPTQQQQMVTIKLQPENESAAESVLVTTASTLSTNNLPLGCHKRLFRFKAVKSDAAGNKCFGWVTSSVCYGSCDTGQFSDHVFPYKKSVHKVCTHGKRIQKKTILTHCSSPDVDSTLREYSYVDAGSCVCKSCSSVDTTCLGSLSTPELTDTFI